MRYDVEISPGARRDLRRLPRQIQPRIRDAIDGLESDPRPPGYDKLTGQDNRYRIRVGDYRVIYEIHDDVLLVLIVRAGRRDEVYRP